MKQQLQLISKLVSASEKKTRTTTDTIMVTPELLEHWKSPPFQRPVSENDKVRALAESMKVDGGVWPGTVTLGIWNGVTYVIDGQHRKASFLISGLEQGYTDVRVLHVSSMAEMGEEFVRLNSQLVRMRPDDILRGLEESVPALKEIRRCCPFVGYDQIRRGPSSPVVSMSMLLRIWRGSAANVPGSQAAGLSTPTLATTLVPEEAEQLIHFLTEAHLAFGREVEYARLWGGLNMVLCMWLYRRLVITQYSPKSPRLTREQFRKCLMSLSADSTYMDWLVGRHIGERDRSPAYGRIKSCFAIRLKAELQRNISLPQPDWSHK